ncbi:MAG: DUF2461 domain-containing protein [Oscillospiraceae bacterium]|nr:DUF2461 domain-containing protein [Oscillospiraceae bacterium]
MFQGFSQNAVEFLWGISLNNERAWFAAHKQDYLDYVDRPLRALSQQLFEAMSAAYPREGFTQHVSRIYRDARRLYGRGPYKDHLWLVIARAHSVQQGRPAFYFELAPNYYSYGCGFWDMTPELAAKHRARIDRDPKPLSTLARRLNRSKFSLYGDEYKRPKGDPGKLLAPWYNRKNLGISFDDNCEGVLFTPQLADDVLEGFRFLMPYYRYFDSLAADAAPEVPL